MKRLDRLELDFDTVTLDWFALKEKEICITDTGLLINTRDFNGALSGEIGESYLNSIEDKSTLYMFNDSFPALKSPSYKVLNHFSAAWIAERLLLNNPMNLCQGELQHGNRQELTRRWYHLAAVLSGVLCMSVILGNAFYLHVVNAKIAAVDSKIAVVYRQFFPAAQQVISPKFRISQLLTTGLNRSESNTLWYLLDKLAGPFHKGQFSLEQFRFQNQVLTVTLVSQNFAALEALEIALQQAQVKVTQLDASTREQQVVATLELSLGASR
jgi:general secretion pathway protein L